MRRKVSKSSLPEEVWEVILLRLPFGCLAQATQVCKVWNRVIQSKSFARLYRDTVKVLVRYNGAYFKRWKKRCRSKIVDSSNRSHILRSGDKVGFGGLPCPDISLTMAFSWRSNKLYVGNILSDRWQQIPDPDPNVKRKLKCAIFDVGGKIQLVHWGTLECSGPLRILDLSQKDLGWSIVRDFGHFPCEATPVGSSLFLLGNDKGQLLLREFNVRDRTLSSVALTVQPGGTSTCLDSVRVDRHLVASQGKLHMVASFLTDKNGVYQVRGEYLRIQIWTISTADGRATITLVNTFEPHPLLGRINSVVVEDDGFIHIYGQSNDHEILAVIGYNMKANCVEYTRHVDYCETMKLTVNMYQGGIL